MEKFTLNEAFDKLYLMAQEEKLNEDLQDLRESFNDDNENQFLDSIKILQEALLLELAPMTDVTEDDNTEKDQKKQDKDENKKGTDKDNKGGLDKAIEKSEIGQVLSLYDTMYHRAEDKILARHEKSNDMTYKPVPQYTEVTRIQDMKFPQNIIFFIKSLITWIKNNILAFIDKFSNIVRTLLGLKTAESKFSEKELKLNLNKSREIESKYVYNGEDAYAYEKKFSDVLNGRRGTLTTTVKPVSMYNLDPSDVRLFGFNESFNILQEAEHNYDANGVKVIRLDTSRDLFALRQTLEHFFTLFDEAYGSNDEKLFSVEDLEAMLIIFKQTMAAFGSGYNQRHALEVQGQLMLNDDTINAERLKDNLLRTKINTDQLKGAYVTTNQQVKNIASIIGNKNLLGVTQMGVQYAFLSAATYEIMIELINIIDTRLAEAKELDKKLQKMKDSYIKLTQELDKKRAFINAASGMVYTTILQKKVNELYDAARYMTTTVKLRMETLTLYISELNDTRAILKNLNAIPASAASQPEVKKFKSLWDK